MEPTTSFSLSIYSFYLRYFLHLSQNTISYCAVKCLKKQKIVVGKVIAAKASGIFSLYIGNIRFVITKLGKVKRLTEIKEIN
jgi:hypothetical protein